MHLPLAVKVWGYYALFTRPEFSAERVSYQVMTPSAARGVLEAIFWKPEMTWQIREIQVLKPIQHFSILRNEINSHQKESTAKGWAKRGEGGYYADEDRAQRHSLCLRDVAYLIKADIALKPHANAHPAKYRDQFRRRVKRGQCHHQPYLGTREFSAFFGEPDEDDRPINHSDDLGLMLFDMEFTPAVSNSNLTYLTHGNSGAKVTQGVAKPKVFRARLDSGVLRIPIELYNCASEAVTT